MSFLFSFSFYDLLFAFPVGESNDLDQLLIGFADLQHWCLRNG